MMPSQEARINAIKSALAQMDLEATKEAILAVVTLMQNEGLSEDDAVLAYAESQGQQRTQQVNYQGKTPGDYQNFAGKKKLEHHFEIAHVGAVEDAESIEDLQARLTAQILLQKQANGSTAAKTAQYILGGKDGYNQAKEELMGAIDGHFVTEEVASDVFTKALSGGSSLPQLKAAA